MPSIRSNNLGCDYVRDSNLTSGVVHLEPWDVDSGALASSITALLDDTDGRESLGRRGQEYAESWGFDQVAERLLSVLRALVPARP